MEHHSTAQSEVTPTANPETVQKEIALHGFKTTFLALEVLYLSLMGLGLSLFLLDQLVPNWVTDLSNKHMLVGSIGFLIVVSVPLNIFLVNFLDRKDRRWRGLLSGKEKIKFILIALAIGLTMPAITLVIIFFNHL